MDTRPDPEQLLLATEREAKARERGRLKVFLGYRARVGKSYRMLDEGRRRAARGEDVVVGAVQARYPPEAEAVLAQLEVIPMAQIEGTPVMDVVAILRRRPQICLLDGLAYSNPPNCARAERWQDAEALLAGGVSVIASLNLQHIAERRPAVEAILGGEGRALPRAMVPERFLRQADEIEVVDAPPEATQADDIGKLTELRELALLLAADVVDLQLEAYLRRHGIEQFMSAQERILLCLSDSPAEDMIASGRRNADRFHGELIAVHVAPAKAARSPALERNLQAAREAGAEIVPLEGDDCVAPIVQLVRERGVTQIFLGHGRPKGGWRRWRRRALNRLIRRAEGADLRIFPSKKKDGRA
ncbi:MAG: hypothetical protein ACRD2H_13210 [Terriglobales bacterium]